MAAKGIQLELYASHVTLSKGEKIWFQTRLTNQTSQPVRFPKADLTGEFGSQSYTTLMTGDRVLHFLGDEAENSRQVMVSLDVREERFFTIPAKATVVVRTESINRYLEFRRPGVTTLQKGDLSSARETLLKPGEYRFTTVFGHQHRDEWSRDFAGHTSEYRWQGRTRTWSKTAPQGIWKATAKFRVTSPNKTD